MRQLLRQKLTTFFLLLVSCGTIWADDFTVERAVNIDQLDSWADISKFQWQVIDHGIQDNREEMDALKTLFFDPAPKDTVGFYKQIYKARDNQYIVLRLDKHGRSLTELVATICRRKLRLHHAAHRRDAAGSEDLAAGRRRGDG